MQLRGVQSLRAVFVPRFSASGEAGKKRPVSVLRGADEAQLSKEARELAAIDSEERDAVEESEATDAKTGGQELSDSEQEQVEKLKRRDREVRAHENAHKAAAGQLAAGGPTYEYQVGPDGRRYAVGGEVKIRLESGSDPRTNLQNAQRARRAALAPQSPSPQDRRVAAQAAQLAAEARKEIQEERAPATGRTQDEGGEGGELEGASQAQRPPSIDVFA